METSLTEGLTEVNKAKVTPAYKQS